MQNQKKPENTVLEEKAVKAVKPFLCIGHPRCGTAFLSHLLTEFGYKVGHEVMGESGISSWTLAVITDAYPAWKKDGGLSSISFNNIEYTYIIHLVRNPCDAIPSIILENKYSEISYSFRRKYIKQILNIDLPEYNSGYNMMYDTEIAVLTFIYWNKLCEMRKPTHIIQLESAISSLSGFNRRKIDEKSINTKVNSTESRTFGGAKHKKPTVDLNGIDCTLKVMLNVFCSKYKYPLLFVGLKLGDLYDLPKCANKGCFFHISSFMFDNNEVYCCHLCKKGSHDEKCDNKLAIELVTKNASRDLLKYSVKH